MEGGMTLAYPEKSKPESAKAVELAEHVRNAAALKYTKNLADAESATLFNVSVYTIADWKKRKEWNETIKELSNRQFGDTYNEVRAMAPAAREVLVELLRDGPPAIRLKIVQTICDFGRSNLSSKAMDSGFGDITMMAKRSRSSWRDDLPLGLPED